MTQQQHLNHSPQKEEFKAINTARQLNNARGSCKHCRGCKPDMGASGSNHLPLARQHFTMCSKAARRQVCTSSSLFAITGSSLPWLPAPHKGIWISASKHQTRSLTREQNRGREICPRAGFSTACQVPLIQGFY